jgi:hypothetical protein
MDPLESFLSPLFPAVASFIKVSFPSQTVLAAFSDAIASYNDEDRTVEKSALLLSGKRRPCPGEKCECPLTAFCEATLKSVTAACSIQVSM